MSPTSTPPRMALPSPRTPSAMRTHAPLAVLLCVLALIPWRDVAAQSFDATGVIHVFVSQVIGGETSYAIVPVPTSRVRSDMPTRVAISAAFDLLRADKPATYDGASLRLTDADIEARQAAVHLTGNASSNFPVIAAETVYTFTAYGIDRVVFPGIHEDGLTRADIPFASYRPQLPLWQALPPTDLRVGDVVLSDGTRIAAMEFRERWAANEPGLRADLLAFLQRDDPFSLYGALRRVKDEPPPGYEDAVIPLLAHADPGLRRLAMDAVASSRQPEAWDAVLERMRSDDQGELRAHAARLLGESPLDQYHLYASFFAIETVSSEDRPAAVRQLATIDDPRARDQLVSLLEHAESAVTSAALDALATSLSFARLHEAMQNDGLAANVRVGAAQLLAENDDPAHRLPGLRFQLDRLEGERALVILDDIVDIPGDDARVHVAASLEHPDQHVRVAAARALGARAEPASIDALAGAHASAEPDSRLAVATAEAAFQILVALPADQIERRAGSRETFVRRAALRAWGVAAAEGRAPANVYDALVTRTADTDPGTRGGAVLALAAFRNQQAFERVMGAADDDDDAVLADVARALSAFDEPAWIEEANAVLSTYVQSGTPTMQAWALHSVGVLGLERLMPIVLQRIESSDASVRAAAMVAAVDLVREDPPRPVINAVIGRVRDPSQANRVVALEQLGRLNHELAVLGISQVINERDAEVRLAAIDALGSTGHPGAVGPLVSILEESDPHARRASLRALRALGLAEGATRIEGVLDRLPHEETRQAAQELAAWLRQNGR
ncbi:MAG: HEAT repeat domain-containing protein [Deltaproteobacteria bacterium]|nr:MAG: HEAT repeat domain-containing protein [Deltaproteobacteria bacterium]